MSTLDEKRYSQLRAKALGPGEDTTFDDQVAPFKHLGGDPWDEMSDALDIIGWALDEMRVDDAADIEAAALGLIHLKEWLVSHMEKVADGGDRVQTSEAIDDLEVNAEFGARLGGMAAGYAAVANEEGPFMALGAKGQPHTIRGSSLRNVNPHVVTVFSPNGDALGVALRSNGDVVALEVIR